MASSLMFQTVSKNKIRLQTESSEKGRFHRSPKHRFEDIQQIQFSETPSRLPKGSGPQNKILGKGEQLRFEL